MMLFLTSQKEMVSSIHTLFTQHQVFKEREKDGSKEGQYESEYQDQSP